MSKSIIEHLIESNKFKLKSIEILDDKEGKAEDTLDNNTKEYIKSLEKENRKLKEIIKMLLED